MFCNKCGKQLAGGAKFCPKCGTKVSAITVDDAEVETFNAEVDDGDEKEAEVVNTEVALRPNTGAPKQEVVATIPSLKDHLLALRDAQDSDSALTYAIEAQLQVLDVLNSPAMTSSTFDLMIESLYKALKRTDDPKQITELQSRAAIMAKNMVFFMEAKLRYEEDKHSAAGKALLQKGCSMLAESASAVMTGGISAGVKIAGGKLFDNLMADDSFFSMLFDFIGKKERIQKNWVEFNEFLINFVDKLGRYRDLFGKSILLSELVYQYKKQLISNQDYEEPEEPCGLIYRKGMWIKSLFIIAFLFVVSMIVLVIVFPDLSEANLILGIEIALGVYFGTNFIYLFSCIGASLGEKRAYKKALKAYDRQSVAVEEYYDLIAESFSVNTGERQLASPQTPASLKRIIAPLQHYERLHRRRAATVRGKKSWMITVLLCVGLGFIGGHRFYVGKIGTGILMLLTVATGISVIWAIIDLITIFAGKFTDKEGNPIRL